MQRESSSFLNGIGIFFMHQRVRGGGGGGREREREIMGRDFLDIQLNR